MITTQERTLTHLLDSMEEAADREIVTLRHILDEFGDRSITPVILVAALLLVSPLSGIFGVSTFIAILVIVLSAQALWGRERLWLPDFLLEKQMKSAHLLFCVRWLRKPCAFFDRHSGRRLQFLTVGPLRAMTLLTCTILPIAWPLLEFVPFASSVGGATVALFSYGLFTRDGLHVLLGYLTILVTSLTFLMFAF